MTPIPDYADVMTVKEFSDSVKIGAFTNDDGSGYYANPPLMEDHLNYLDCREIYKGNIKTGFTHVAWFNK